MIVVRDVESSSSFYRALLGCTEVAAAATTATDRPSTNGLYDPFLHHTQWGADGLVLQLHSWEADHHHGPSVTPTSQWATAPCCGSRSMTSTMWPTGLARLHAPVVLDVHVNPNAGHRELWITDPDGYTVVIASPDGTA